MKTPSIVVVGSVNTDMVCRISRMPGAGETLLGGSFAMAPGGKGANQAVAAARLGGRVTLVAMVGDDALGAEAIAGFQRDGIVTKYIQVDRDAPSGVASIWVDEQTGGNRIVVASGANARLTPSDVIAARDAIANADVVVCQLEVPLDAVTAAFTIAQEFGVPTLLNPAPAQALPADLLSRLTYITPNEVEIGQIAGNTLNIVDAAGILRSAGVGTVVVTLGAEGCTAVHGGGAFTLPAIRVDRVVDTTAAGDCFTGALAVALGEGQDLKGAMAFAVAASGLSVTRAEAQPSLPSRDEVLRLMALQEEFMNGQ